MDHITAHKIEMTQIFREDGVVVPVTRVQLDTEAAINPGDVIDVTGTSKGKGFAGVVKRYSFAGGPKTHGQSDRHRAPGSIGSGTFPARVWRGQRMAGRMGGARVTVKNLEVVAVESGVVAIKGAVPGARHDVLTIKVVKSAAPVVTTEESES